MQRITKRFLFAGAALALVFTVASTSPRHQVEAKPAGVAAFLNKLTGGTWGGSTRIKLKNGKTQSARCRVRYTSSGSTWTQQISCGVINSRATFFVQGNRISGSWRETYYGAGGNFSGSGSASSLSLSFAGSAGGSMRISGGSSSHTVSLSVTRPQKFATTVSLRR